MLKVKAFHKLSSLTFKAMSIPEIPERISFPYLEKVHVNSSDLKDFVAFEKWHAPRLKEISLSRHVELQRFKGIDPFLKTLSTLRFTNMEIHSFEGLINKALPQLHQLAFNCVFSDRALKELQYLDLKNVKQLYLHIFLDANATHQGPTIRERKPLKNLTCFPSLFLPKVTYLALPRSIKSLTGLERLYTPKLKILDLRHCEVSSTEIQKLQRVLGPKVKILKPIKIAAVRTL
jgi:hypothetical protein